MQTKAEMAIYGRRGREFARRRVVCAECREPFTTGIVIRNPAPLAEHFLCAQVIRDEKMNEIVYIPDWVCLACDAKLGLAVAGCD